MSPSSSRALILKRAVDYITLLQAQIKEYKLEIEEVRRHNDALAQHTQIGLRPLISQLQLHHSRHSPTALQQDAALHHPQPTYATSHHVTSPTMPTSAAMLAAAQQQQQQRQQQMHSPQLPPYSFSSGTAMGHSVHPTSSINESKSPPSGFVPPSPPTFASNPVNSATQHLSDALQQLSRPSAPLDLAGLSQLLLQNPLLAAQLQQTQSQPINIPHSSHSEGASVTSPSSLGSLYGTMPTTTQTTSVSDHSVDTDARLLSSLALRERQLAAAIRL
ncbi:hypothetical protein AAVH_27862 [Aphelenchoides avenae]|nr:hypothetical protein AAVH_27862 [Aphelenchus avenae]